MSETAARLATEHDSESIMTLWRVLMAFHQEVAPHVWTLTSDAEERYRGYLNQMMQDANRRIFIAEQDGEAVGYLVAAKGQRPPVLVPSARGVLEEICVAPTARRRGVAKALVAEAMEWFQQEGMPMVEVGYATDNPISGAFWQAQGFRPYRVTAARFPSSRIHLDTKVCEGDSYFVPVAESYDRLQPIVAGPSYQAGLAFVLEFLPQEPAHAFTCVELGCGTATLTDRVLARFPRASAIAIDSEPAMLDMARQKLEKHGDRAQVREGEATTCKLPPCEVVLSSFMLHHVPPEALGETLHRIAKALRPGGCFILLDQMTAGPAWGDGVGARSRRLYRAGVSAAIAADVTTQAEIDARWAFKRKMKEEGKDVEYRHRAEDLLAAMQDAGFAEVGLVWRMFAATVLVGFVPKEVSDAPV